MPLKQRTMAAWLPILTFHDIDDQRSFISFSPRVFRLGMAKLHESGYQTLSLLEAVDYLRQGTSFPDRSLVITFDDGYQTMYDEAFPVLQRYGLSATVFLTVGEKGTAGPSDRLPSLEGRSMLTWREIREMHRWGINFGAHTLTHPDLARLPFDRVEAEVCDSKAIIEDALGARVDSFAYPYGRYDRRSRQVVQQYFACACSDKLGLITAGSDPYTLERVDAYYLRSDQLFDLMLTRLFPWYIRARRIPRRIRRTFQGSTGRWTDPFAFA
jgi:peptidoglycan/xylan/chitin deacetylase (PgdA/CDA1 family)